MINLTHAQWSQIGQDIDGEAAEDNSGGAVSLNSDGSVVAIGARNNNGFAPGAGHVRVYEYVSNNWIQKGNDIDGEAIGDNFGWAVSLNSDGNTVAIGVPDNDGNGNQSGQTKIYNYSGGNWIQKGSDINGEAAFDHSGRSLSLSSDGTILAIGAADNDTTGHVRVYEYNGIDWFQLGNDIDGEANGDNSGGAVSLSSDGSIVAIGAVGNMDGGFMAGHVRVFGYTGGNWIQIGNDIEGLEFNHSGHKISLNSNGSIVAISSYYDDYGMIVGPYKVRVYENIGGGWIQIGSDIDGGNHSGPCDLSLNSSGNIIVIGDHGGIYDLGYVKRFEYSGGNWLQIGNDIDGEAYGDRSGGAVSLSSNGSIVAIGASMNDGNGPNAGHVRVYGNTSVGIKENTISREISVYPNPTSGKITVKAEGIEGIVILSLQGKQIYNEIDNVIDLSTQPKGMYIIKVITDKQIITQKLIKQ